MKAGKNQGKNPGKNHARGKRENLAGYWFMAPWIAGFLLFTAFPFVYTIFLSFHEVSLTVAGWKIVYTGVNNYLVAFFRNPEFMPALAEFTLMVLAYTPTIIVISFMLALLLNRELRFRAGFRMLFFLPVIVMSGPVLFQLTDVNSTTAVSLAQMPLFRVVRSYSPPLAAALAYIFNNYSMVLWFTGIPIVLFIAALQKINGSVLEAALIDSATAWQILWKITLPLIRTTLLVCCIFTVVQLGLYSDNPLFGMIQNAIYSTTSGLGLASAFAWVYTLILLAIIGVLFFLLKEPAER
jgi:ABC-type sugar transport system permease subunit